ncbi:MAG: uracil-DNA glycosylase [candidate division WOR-3 bacterium]|nr:uracil-DNA glycosylase [candidate division WOR-3 bacterium]
MDELKFLAEILGIKEVFLDENYMDKARVLKLYEERIKNCTKCELHKSRTKFVFSSGNPYARVVLIGEAPGYEEDKKGLPFVGKAGKLLTKILEEINIDREKDVYITNIIKCRPPNNRDPNNEEISTCEPYLKHQIRIIRPSLLVALGRYSGGLLSNKPYDRALKNRGEIIESIYKIPLLITYHPAAALRNPSLELIIKSDLEKIKKFL